MSARAMFRYEVPVDDEPHSYPLTSDPVAVAAAPDACSVEFWAEDDALAASADRTFQVFGTGHPLPDSAKWVGTCQRVRGLVWHLYEVPATAVNSEPERVAISAGGAR